MPTHYALWILIAVSCVIVVPAVLRVSRGKNNKEDE
jgi:hypothetical protein